MIVRIEDTDQARTQTGAIEAILESLRWLDLDWDEGPEVGGDFGPYLQSERLGIYDRYAGQLLDSGAAFHCYCSAERLKAVRDEQSRHKQNPRYDGRCRDVSEQQAKAGGDADVPVVRFRVPQARTISFNDRVRDEVAFESDELGDFVLIKTDRFPTYHMANVVDDHLMEISHVLRAEEWLSSTPRHLLLYEALGMTPPEYGHLPIILGPDRSKLSKRHGAAALLDYRDLGFLPDVMVNYLALMGWALDDHTELFTREMLVKHFTLERVGKSGAIFDITKLAWMNGVYLRELSKERFMEVALPSLESGLPQDIPRPLDQDYLGQVLEPAPGADQDFGRVTGTGRILLCGRSVSRPGGSGAQEDGPRGGRYRTEISSCCTDGVARLGCGDFGRDIETLGPSVGHQDGPAIRCPARRGYGPHGCPTPVRYYGSSGEGTVHGSA